MNKVFTPLIFAVTIIISAWILGSAFNITSKKKTTSITVNLEYAVKKGLLLLLCIHHNRYRAVINEGYLHHGAKNS